jgi:hypothetical protein
MLARSEIAQLPLGDLTLIIAFLSIYVHLGDCQGIVGHLQYDFDAGAHRMPLPSHSLWKDRDWPRVSNRQVGRL